MAKQIAKKEDNALATVPKHLVEHGDDSMLDDVKSSGFIRNNISLRGMRFRLREGSEEISVVRGESLEVIIIGAIKGYQRQFFGPYIQGQGSPPICQSNDGVVPTRTAQEPQNSKCATCTRNAKTQLRDDGSKGRECSFLKRLAIYIPGQGEMAWQLDVKGMSIFGKEVTDEGYSGWNKFVQRLAKDNIEPFKIKTSIIFDESATVPKIMFRPVGWVSKEEYTAARKLMNEEETKAMLTMESDATPPPNADDAMEPEPKANGGMGAKPDYDDEDGDGDDETEAETVTEDEADDFDESDLDDIIDKS